MIVELLRVPRGVVEEEQVLEVLRVSQVVVEERSVVEDVVYLDCRSVGAECKITAIEALCKAAVYI